MKKTSFLFALLIAGVAVMAQNKKTSSTATISFDASTPADPVAKAENKTVIAAIDTKKGTVQFEAAVKNFAFENKRVEEHFNAKRWLDSEAYPKFSFNGKIDNLDKVKFKKDGIYNVTVSGNLTIKETTKAISAPGTITVKGGKISANSNFIVALPDYGVMADGKKVSKEAKVVVNAELN